MARVEPASPAKTRKAPFRRSWRRFLVVFVLLPGVGLVLVALYGAAPLAICWLAHDRVAQRIAGTCDVGWAAVGLDEIELRDVVISRLDGAVMGRAERMRLGWDRPLWGAGKRRVNRVTLVRPEIVLTLGADGRWDLQELLSKPAPQDHEAGTVEKVIIEDGRLELRSDAATVVFHHVSGEIGVEPRRWVLDRLEGRAYGGRVATTGWVGTRGNDGWALQFNVAGVDVTSLTAGTAMAGKNLNGRLEGFLSLDRENGGPPVGAGWLEIRDGCLYELPVLLSVFNLLRLESPGRTVIETTRCEFRVRSDRIEVERAHFLSRGPCMFGGGDIFFDGRRVDLAFVPRLDGEPPEGLDVLDGSDEPVADFIRRNFLVCVEVTGTWTEPKAESVPVRVISRPLKQFFKLLKKQDDGGTR